jgi:hypothetical protein
VPIAHRRSDSKFARRVTRPRRDRPRAGTSTGCEARDRNRSACDSPACGPRRGSAACRGSKGCPSPARRSTAPAASWRSGRGRAAPDTCRRRDDPTASRSGSTDAVALVLHSEGVTATEDPGLELEVAVDQPPSTVDPEELGMEGPAVDEHVVRLQARHLRSQGHLDSFEMASGAADAVPGGPS